MGTKKFKPFPNNQIFNVYAECDQTYNNLKNLPFIDKDSGNVNEAVTYCNVNIVTPKIQFHSNATLHIIGFGSRYYKKLSWSMKLGEKFMGRKAIKLRSLAGDPTLIREKLATELYNAVGVPVQESTYARVIINDDVLGLYGFYDNLSSNWISSYVHGDGKAKVGMTYKMYVDSVNFHYGLKNEGENPDFYRHYMIDEYDEEKYNKDDEMSMYKPLFTFVERYEDWVNNYSNDPSENSVKKLEEFLNVESTLRMMAIDSLVVALDNFWLTGANAALYYNPEKNIYQFLPYDFDLTFQVKDNIPTLAPNEAYMQDCETWTNYADGPNNKANHYFTTNLLKHPLIKNRYEVILAKASREPYNPDTVSKYIHAVADLIRDDVEWNFDVSTSIQSNYEGKVNFYTKEHFEGNLDSKPVWAEDKSVIDNFKYGLLDFVKKRQQTCATFTKDIDISFKENEFDKKRDDDNKDDENSGCEHSLNKKLSILFITITQFILLSVFF